MGSPFESVDDGPLNGRGFRSCSSFSSSNWMVTQGSPERSEAALSVWRQTEPCTDSGSDCGVFQSEVRTPQPLVTECGQQKRYEESGSADYLSRIDARGKGVAADVTLRDHTRGKNKGILQSADGLRNAGDGPVVGKPVLSDDGGATEARQRREGCAARCLSPNDNEPACLAEAEDDGDLPPFLLLRGEASTNARLQAAHNVALLPTLSTADRTVPSSYYDFGACSSSSSGDSTRRSLPPATAPLQAAFCPLGLDSLQDGQTANACMRAKEWWSGTQDGAGVDGTGALLSALVAQPSVGWWERRQRVDDCQVWSKRRTPMMRFGEPDFPSTASECSHRRGGCEARNEATGEPAWQDYRRWNTGGLLAHRSRRGAKCGGGGNRLVYSGGQQHQTAREGSMQMRNASRPRPMWGSLGELNGSRCKGATSAENTHQYGSSLQRKTNAESVSETYADGTGRPAAEEGGRSERAASERTASPSPAAQSCVMWQPPCENAHPAAVSVGRGVKSSVCGGYDGRLGFGGCGSSDYYGEVAEPAEDGSVPTPTGNDGAGEMAEAATAAATGMTGRCVNSQNPYQQYEQHQRQHKAYGGNGIRGRPSSCQVDRSFGGRRTGGGGGGTGGGFYRTATRSGDHRPRVAARLPVPPNSWLVCYPQYSSLPGYPWNLPRGLAAYHPIVAAYPFYLHSPLADDGAFLEQGGAPSAPRADAPSQDQSCQHHHMALRARSSLPPPFAYCSYSQQQCARRCMLKPPSFCLVNSNRKVQSATSFGRPTAAYSRYPPPVFATPVIAPSSGAALLLNHQRTPEVWWGEPSLSEKRSGSFAPDQPSSPPAFTEEEGCRLTTQFPPAKHMVSSSEEDAAATGTYIGVSSPSGPDDRPSSPLASPHYYAGDAECCAASGACPPLPVKPGFPHDQYDVSTLSDKKPDSAVTARARTNPMPSCESFEDEKEDAFETPTAAPQDPSESETKQGYKEGYQDGCNSCGPGWRGEEYTESAEALDPKRACEDGGGPQRKAASEQANDQSAGGPVEGTQTLEDSDRRCRLVWVCGKLNSSVPDYFSTQMYDNLGYDPYRGSVQGSSQQTCSRKISETVATASPPPSEFALNQ